jgi:hypothetical protein
MCGAIFLDRAFEKQVRTMISAEDYERLGTRSKRRMMNDWEYGIKRRFRIDEAEDRQWLVNIPDYLGIQVPEAPDSPSAGFSLSRSSSIASLISMTSIVDAGTLVLKT